MFIIIKHHRIIGYRTDLAAAIQRPSSCSRTLISVATCEIGRPLSATRRTACSRSSGVYFRRFLDTETSFPQDQQSHDQMFTIRGQHHSTADDSKRQRWPGLCGPPCAGRRVSTRSSSNKSRLRSARRPGPRESGRTGAPGQSWDHVQASRCTTYFRSNDRSQAPGRFRSCSGLAEFSPIYRARSAVLRTRPTFAVAPWLNATRLISTRLATS